MAALLQEDVLMDLTDVGESAAVFADVRPMTEPAASRDG